MLVKKLQNHYGHFIKMYCVGRWDSVESTKDNGPWDQFFITSFTYNAQVHAWIHYFAAITANLFVDLEEATLFCLQVNGSSFYICQAYFHYQIKKVK